MLLLRLTCAGSVTLPYQSYLLSCWICIGTLWPLHGSGILAPLAGISFYEGVVDEIPFPLTLCVPGRSSPGSPLPQRPAPYRIRAQNKLLFDASHWEH
jgi:hypothetical protein